VTSAIGIVPLLAAHPLEVGVVLVVVVVLVVAWAATTAVGTEVEVLEPSAFVAVTATRRVLATSGPTSV
jgi:hypothetical protein